MSRRFLRPMIVGAILLLLPIMTVVPTSAAYRHQFAFNPRSVSYPQHITTHLVPNAVLDPGVKGTHYLYADDGTNPDSIDVWKIGKTLTHVGNYPDNANNYGIVYDGTQKLAIAKKDKAHGNCLLQVDSNKFSPPGFINSYPINADGSLGSQVSHVHVKDTSVATTEVHIAGDTAYVNDAGSSGGDFESYAVGARCTLTFLSSAAANGQNTNFALVDSKFLVAPNGSTNAIDVFTLGKGGIIIFLKSTTSQVTNPDGVAVQVTKNVTNVFTGGQTDPAEAQGGQLNAKTGAVSFLKGSPATDSNAFNGIQAIFDYTDSLLVQGEYNSQAVSTYSVKTGSPGKVGSIAFLQQTALPSASLPQDLVQFGQTLFVLGLGSGTIDACTLSKSGASGCANAAKVTASSPFSSGLAIL